MLKIFLCWKLFETDKTISCCRRWKIGGKIKKLQIKIVQTPWAKLEIMKTCNFRFAEMDNCEEFFGLWDSRHYGVGGGRKIPWITFPKTKKNFFARKKENSEKKFSTSRNLFYWKIILIAHFASLISTFFNLIFLRYFNKISLESRFYFNVNIARHCMKIHHRKTILCFKVSRKLDNLNLVVNDARIWNKLIWECKFNEWNFMTKLRIWH